MDSKFEICFENVITGSTYNEQTKEYKQIKCKNSSVCGIAERENYIQLLYINLFLHKFLFPKNNLPNLDKKNLLEICFNVLQKAKNIKFGNLNIDDAINSIIDIGISFQKKNNWIDQLLEFSQEHSKLVESINKTILNIDNLRVLKNEDLKKLVSDVFELNRLMFPNYSMNLIGCCMNQFFVMFLDELKFTSNSQLKPQSFYINMFCSSLQRILFDETMDNFLLCFTAKNLNIENNYNAKNIVDLNFKKELIQQILKQLNSKHCIKNKFPRSNLKKNLDYDRKSMITMYEKCLTNMVEIDKELSFHSELSIIPYIFFIRSSRKDRMYACIKSIIPKILTAIKIECKKTKSESQCKTIIASIQSIDNHFELYFEEIFFPNFEMSKITTENAKRLGKIKSKNIVYNLNDFSICSVTSSLMETISKIVSTYKEFK